MAGSRARKQILKEIAGRKIPGYARRSCAYEESL
jgi:hypothetical protein